MRLVSLRTPATLAIGILIGAHLYTPAGAAKNPCPAPSPAVHGHTIFALSGGGASDRKFDSNTFKVTSPFTVNYSAAPIKGMEQFQAGTFSVTIQNSQNATDYGMDLVAEELVSAGDAPHHGSTTESHLDCVGGCYFTIESKAVNWTLSVTH